MTRIDFYILQHGASEERYQYTCRLVEKAVAQGNRVFIATADATETRTLDELLWRFRPESFVPHQMLGETLVATPVLISHAGDDPDHHQVLVNLRADIPPQFSRYQRLVEISDQTPQTLQVTRNHYAFYKSRGYALKDHKIT